MMMKGKGKDIAGSSVKDGEIHEVNGRAQIQDTALAESWLAQVKRRLSSSHKKWQVSENVCIYRVPKPMRISKDEVFDPFLVSLGPFHHKMSHKLSTMDELKIDAVHRTLTRLKETGKDVTEKDLIAHITLLDPEIRKCYEEPIQWDKETLSWMLAMDACFILEFFKMAASEKSEVNSFNLVFQNSGRLNLMYHAIINDIMKMENQIPLVILTCLLTMEFPEGQRAKVELCKALLRGSNLFEGFPFHSPIHEKSNIENFRIQKLLDHVSQGAVHLLDLYRRVIKDLLTNSSRESASRVDGEFMTKLPSAELLHTAGIKFEPGEIGFRKDGFGKCTLSLPQITVDGSTVTLLGNVIAYEECQRCLPDPKETVISHYLVLLDYLIDSAKDVSVLRKARVISSLAVSDKDIACRFNNINQGITVGTYKAFEELMKKATEHYESQWNVWISQIQEERCSRPWYLIPVLVGLFLLLMTALQTVYAVLSYKKQR